VNDRHIWVLIVFSLWHQIYIERTYDPVALGWEKAQGGGALTRPGVSLPARAGPFGSGGVAVR
jgi:hypothetical protein